MTLLGTRYLFYAIWQPIYFFPTYSFQISSRLTSPIDLLSTLSTNLPLLLTFPPSQASSWSIYPVLLLSFLSTYRSLPYFPLLNFLLTHLFRCPPVLSDHLLTSSLITLSIFFHYVFPKLIVDHSTPLSSFVIWLPIHFRATYLSWASCWLSYPVDLPSVLTINLLLLLI